MADQITEFSGTVPALNQTQPDFDQNTQAFIDYMANLAPELNAFAASLNTLSTNSSSTSNVSIGTGTKNFTIETGKSLFVGMSYKMAYDANNWMLGDIISYNSGTGALSIDVDTVRGSGTYAAWVGTLSFNGQIEGSQLSPTLISGQTAETSPATDDELLLSDTSEGALNKITLQDLLKVINGLTEDTAPDLNADYVLTYDASAAAVKKVLAGRLNVVSGTAQATTSGTTKDFTDLPSWLNVLVVTVSALSSNGTSSFLLQFGDSGGLETTNYLGACVYAGNAVASVGSTFTTGFGIFAANAASVISGGFVFARHSGDTWVCMGSFGFSNSAFAGAVGMTKTLSATLDRFRLTSISGDTFDNGSINWMGW